MSELGKGAMGIVYLGRDPVIGRMVALKTIRAVGDDEAEQREFGERFLREAQAAGILSHPNIVTIHDVGEDPDSHTSFIAMEYVEGKNLKQLVSEKTAFSYERVADIIGQVAEALDYAHRKGIVHRDVKPANIIITSEGAVKITDFGIAKIEQSNLTSTGQFLGTPNYMSPEQVTGDPVDGRSDLFSLGVCLYELLTRKKPFQGDNLTSISYKIVHEPFTPPEVYDAAIPPEFGPTMLRGLAKDPAERFQRGNDFALALYEFKARQEERQMLRDLGRMVAEAENLGGNSLKTAIMPLNDALFPTGRAGSSSIPVSTAPAPHETIPDSSEPAPSTTMPAHSPERDAASAVDVSAPDWTLEDEVADAAVPEGAGVSLRNGAGKLERDTATVMMALEPQFPDLEAPDSGLTERLDLRSAMIPPPVSKGTREALEDVSTKTPSADALEDRPTQHIYNAAELARLGGPTTPLRANQPAPPALPPLAAPPDIRVEARPAEAVSEPAPARRPRSSSPNVPAAPPQIAPAEKAKGPSGEKKTSTPVQNLKRQVNSRYAIPIAGGVLLLALAVVALLLNKRSSIQPTAPVEDQLVKETAERRQLMTDGESFVQQGKLEEALKSFRELARRSPGSAPALEAVSRTEALIAAQKEKEAKIKQVDEHLASAREAQLVPDDQKVIAEADLALTLDPANTEAQTLKSAALERLSTKTLAEQKKEQLSAKKKLKPKVVPTVAAPVAVTVKSPEASKAPVPTPAIASVRISFQSPIARGLLMIGLNDKIVFRKDFDFGKNSSGGMVDGSVNLASGPGTLKVWVLATDRSFKPYKAIDLVVPGDAKILRIDLDASKSFSVSLR